MRLILKKLSNRALICVIDCLLILSAWMMAYWLRFNLSHIPSLYLTSALTALPWVAMTQIFTYFLMGLHRGQWRYSSMADLRKIIKVVIIATAISFLGLFLFDQIHDIPRSIIPLNALLLICFLGGVRFTYRWYRERGGLFPCATRILIVGANSSGENLVREILRNHKNQYTPIAFVDDNSRKQGFDIHGIRVVGSCKDIPHIVKDYNIEKIIIAVPCASSKTMRHIVEYCESANVHFHTLPYTPDLTNGNLSVDVLRNVSLNDLLGRDQVTQDWDKIQQHIHHKVVMVTGGAGSIGIELCRQIAQLSPAKLLILDNNEYSLYKVEHELQQHDNHKICHFLLANITDKVAIEALCQQYKPHIIFHAAAYKHVPLLESQIRSTVINNVFGTCIVAEAAAKCGTQEFILISTDKVVNPSNVMGATKRIAELFCQNYNRNSQTRFTTVRFGNVLGSKGSVVPLFEEQLQKGGPLTVTHPNASRFFMTIQEACTLILEASTLSKGGEIFILDMGEPLKISYIAEQVIKLAGKSVKHDIDIVYTGLRPGEKLHEQLFYQQETILSTNHAKILQARSMVVDWRYLQHNLQQLQQACHDNNLDKMQHILARLSLAQEEVATDNIEMNN